MIETVRSIVHAWECDSVQHFTTAYYFRALSSATAMMSRTLGLESEEATEPWTRACWTKFTKELRAGDAYHMTSGVIAVQDDAVQLGHKLFNSETGDICTSFVQTIATSHRPRGALAQIEWEERTPQRQVLVKPDAKSFRTSGGVVRPEDVDWSGRLDLSTLIHFASDANVQFQNRIGMTSSYMRENKAGFSTAEYQLTVHEPPPRSGVSVEVKSTLAHIGRTSLSFVHDLYEAEGGRKLASLAQLGVHLDLVSRRPSPVPDQIRSRVQDMA